MPQTLIRRVIVAVDAGFGVSYVQRPVKRQAPDKENLSF
jgi:hypothetical protein